jgi:uncharacterized protein YgiM (DUF1202 family)
MKQKPARRLLALLLLAALVLQPGGSFAAEETGQILGNEVNLRSLPDVSGTSLAKLNLGDEVTILEESGDWYKVTCNGMTGYVLSSLVFVKSVTDRIAYSSVDGVNLRGGASESSFIITTISAGHPVRIRQMVGEWYFVSYQGECGFVRRDMVKISNMSGIGGSATLLKYGMEGSEVKKMQQELSRRNFLPQSAITGYYGAKTREAVKDFQKAAKMSGADGVAGPETLAVLYDRTNNIKKTIGQIISAQDIKGLVRMIDWWEGGSTLVSRNGGIATVTDVKTGKSFKIRRSGGHKHMDVHPLTASDTAVMKSIVGKWSWARRAIWLTVNGRVYAASMNCMPHSPDPSKSDNFPGHFCIHLKNSRTHGGNNVDPDHQACIQRAYKVGNGN